MSIAVQCESGGGVSEVALYGLYIIPGADGIDGVCMAKIVETDTNKASGVQNSRETFLRFPLVQRLPYLRREYHVILIIPQRSHL